MSYHDFEILARGHSFERHEHSLCLRNDKTLKQPFGSCGLCKQSVAGPFYACDPCKYFVHESCNDLPLQITLPFHPSHPLRLYCNEFTWCDSCHRDLEHAAFYKCVECKICVDVECATLAPSGHDGQIVRHSSHPHSLSLVDKRDSNCIACKSRLSGQTYACGHCDFFLHKSCAELPVSPHPLHPCHDRLSLVVNREFTCSVCETAKEGKHNFNFKCDRCEFRMCWVCKTSKRNVEFEDHEHALCFVERSGKKDLDLCNGYEAYCRRYHNSKEFGFLKSSIFRCSDCDFWIHLLCGPLPSTIKHQCHIHALTLFDSVVEDDSGEHYCDVCETERDPRIRVYHCKECKYFAHVYCVISEIVEKLKGEPKSVELKALGRDTWVRAMIDEQADQSTALTLKDLLNRIHRRERDLLECYYVWDGDKPDRSPSTDDEINEALQCSRFTDREFEKFCGGLEPYSEQLELKPSDLGLKLVKVKGYLIPRSLADVLATLLGEYGDRVAHSQYSMSLEMKSFVLFVLCQTVKRMHATLVKDITKNLLREWYFHLKFVVRKGFKDADFALEQFESLVDAFLGLQARRLEDKIPKTINARIAQMRQRIDEMERGLEKCEEYRGSSEKSEYMNYCLKKAYEAEWHNSFDVIRDGGQSRLVPRQRWRW